MSELRRLPQRARPPEVSISGNGVTMIDCAGPSTEEGAYAEIGPGVKVGTGFKIGFYTTIGPGAVIGHGSPLGTWSSVGPYSQIGNRVRFGDWSKVGMDCIVDSGARLKPHEYVPSGHRRHASGRLTRIPQFERFRAMHGLYDDWKQGWGSDMYLCSTSERRAMELEMYEAGLQFADGLRTYLEERESIATNPFVVALESLVGRRLRPMPDQALFDWKPEIRYPRDHLDEIDDPSPTLEQASDDEPYDPDQGLAGMAI